MAPSNRIPSLPEILSADEVCRALRITPRTLHRWRRQHPPLPVSRPPGGRRLIILRDELLAWLRSQCERPPARPLRKVAAR